MLNSNVIGRLGADAELKQTKNGKNFVSYRGASDGFVNGNKITQWVRVTDFTEKGNRLLQYLKKGSLVNVSGILSVSQYQSNKDGSTMFSIDLNADRVDFISNVSGSTTTDETVVVQQATNKVEKKVSSIVDGVFIYQNCIAKVCSLKVTVEE